jgi:hypothetical protein
VDVNLKLWVRGDHKTTLHEISDSGAAGQPLHPEFRQISLEPGAAPESLSVRLRPRGDEELAAREGDFAELRLVFTRGRKRKLKVRIASEGDSWL